MTLMSSSVATLPLFFVPFEAQLSTNREIGDRRKNNIKSLFIAASFTSSIKLKRALFGNISCMPNSKSGSIGMAMKA
jgi:hypothetical protein